MNHHGDTEDTEFTVQNRNSRYMIDASYILLV
jgi:hypothetical protein